MNATPTISVVVPTYNRAHLLPRCLESLLAQSRPPDQLLVVDDGSEDDTPQVLRGYGDRIEWLRTENGGKSHALNLAMPRLRGEYVWIFDDDDLALPDALERLVAVVQARPDAGVIYSSHHLQVADGPRVHKPLPEVDESDVFLRNLVQNFLQPGGMLVKLSCYREVGPFDVSLRRSEDFEMAQRLTRRFACVALPGAPTFVYHQHGGKGGSDGEPDTIARERAWLSYDQTLVSRLVAELELWELLPGRR
ncbi:MAG: glycosyltransferase family 2 protein, partial [Thermoanaerobaculia bacterium]|nr:glycosyltransferase family 2 protein [Thermoanaerobaculia bacterium]